MNEILIILAVAVLIIIIKVKKRKYFWKAKDGTELSLKEFLARWKKGVEGITPIQQTKTTLMGIWITTTGIIAGIVVNALIRLKDMWWWIEIILIGSLIVTGVSLLGTYQKYKAYKRIDEEIKKINGEIKND